jgi:inhibitor of KinA
LTSFTIFPLGDSAITLDLGNTIDELHNIKVLAIYDWLRAHPFPGLLDIIAAYSSVSVFYDPAVLRASGVPGDRGASHWVEGLLRKAMETAEPPDTVHSGNTFHIPVCYEQEFGPDLPSLAGRKRLSVEEVIQLHSAIVYRVYMIGFLPGFSYMGTVDERLQLQRKERPVPVAAGGVGIAGMQTGIYPLSSPGGWQIIGRTPLKLFDPAKEPPILLRAGDNVQFHPISSGEFRELSGRPM